MTFTISVPIWTLIPLVLLFFYRGFILYAGAQQAAANKEWAALIPIAPELLIAGAIDIVFNQAFGRLMFWELRYTLTFSERLDLHFHDNGWRGWLLARPIGNFLDKILFNHIH